MADNWQSIGALAEAPATTDDVLLRDVSDTTDDATGTVKRNAVSDFLASTLKLAGGTLTGALTLGSGASVDGGGKQIAHHLLAVVTGVSDTLTITAHSGNAIVTGGNITVPTITGFHCTVIAGGVHTISFNGTMSAAMAAGDIVSLVVESATVIHAVKVLAASKIAFA
jgi:hypothetical protein